MSNIRRCSAFAFALAALVWGGPAMAHDASCVTVYQCFGVNQPVPLFIASGDYVLDDVHQTATQTILCAVDVKGKASNYGTLSVVVHQGTPDDLAPGTLLAGPVDTFMPPGGASSVAVHVEMPGIVLPKDSWIGVAWHDYQSNGSVWLVSTHDPVTVGTSHDVFYESIAPAGAQFSDFGNVAADLNLQVEAAPAVPASPSTWGEVKATYR